jgi:hypothetical protein
MMFEAGYCFGNILIPIVYGILLRYATVALCHLVCESGDPV